MAVGSTLSPGVCGSFPPAGEIRIDGMGRFRWWLYVLLFAWAPVLLLSFPTPKGNTGRFQFLLLALLLGWLTPLVAGLASLLPTRGRYRPWIRLGATGVYYAVSVGSLFMLTLDVPRPYLFDLLLAGPISLGPFAAALIYLAGRPRITAFGLCRACGYDLRGAPGAPSCPECGLPP